MRFDKYLMTEGKVVITPYLKSSFKKQNDFSSDMANKVSKEVAKALDKDTKAELGIEAPLGKGRPYVRLKRQDREYDSVSSAVGDALGKARIGITDSEQGDGGTWMIYIIDK